MKEKHYKVVAIRTSRSLMPGCHGDFTKKHASEANKSPWHILVVCEWGSVTNKRIGALKLVVRYLLGFNSILLDHVHVAYSENVCVPVFHKACTDNFKMAEQEFCETLRVPILEGLVTVLLK
jgi:hypothetical protein